jgi:hypothetical protein
MMDEPSDRRNWNGNLVSRADIDEMARYSKEIWPELPTIIRGWEWYLKGYDSKYLDAAWAGYVERFGSIDEFVSSNVRDAKASGLNLVVGLNVLAGGGKEGLPGYKEGRNSMTAAQMKASEVRGRRARYGAHRSVRVRRQSARELRRHARRQALHLSRGRIHRRPDRGVELGRGGSGADGNRALSLCRGGQVGGWSPEPSSRR